MTNQKRRRQTRRRLTTGMDPIAHNRIARMEKTFNQTSKSLRAMGNAAKRAGRIMRAVFADLSERLAEAERREKVDA